MSLSPAVVAFFEESESHLEVAESSLLLLDRDKTDADAINELFRSIHSLKGNSGLVGFLDIHEVASKMEQILDVIRKSGEPAPQEEMDKLFEMLDNVKLLVDAARGDGEKEAVTKTETLDDVPTATPETTPAETIPEPTVEVAAEKSPEPQVAEVSKQTAEVEPNKKSAEELPAKEAKKRKRADKQMSYLTFMLGNECYGVNITSVREIILKRKITSVPMTKDYMIGIMNLRGMIIPVINAKARLGFKNLTSNDSDLENIVIIEDGSYITGVLVDSVDDIKRFKESMIERVAHIVGGGDSDLIEGVGKAENCNVMLLSVQYFCSSEDKFY